MGFTWGLAPCGESHGLKLDFSHLFVIVVEVWSFFPFPPLPFYKNHDHLMFSDDDDICTFLLSLLIVLLSLLVILYHCLYIHGGG